MRTFPTDEDVEQFKQRARTRQFTALDLDAFYKNPRLWRPRPKLIALCDAQEFWQGVYDELAPEIGGRIIVPPAPPRLTVKQHKSVEKFQLLLVYIPALTEDRYPACFVKPDWCGNLKTADVERKPLQGQWVAFETIKKPHWDDPIGYPDDRLATVLKLKSRFGVSWVDLKNGLLERVAKITGFPKKGTRLCTVEEWNFVANLINWLREHRGMDLPDLGSTRSWEWCENSCDASGWLIVGRSGHGGLAAVDYDWHDGRDGLGFRVLFVL